MLGFVIRAVIVAVGLWVAAQIVPGVGYSDLTSLLLAALLLGVVNAILRPVAMLLSLPILIVTLGLFMLVINAAMLSLVAVFIRGLYLHGFGSAILASLVVSIISFVASRFIDSRGRLSRKL